MPSPEIWGYPAKPPITVIAGLLTLTSDYRPPFSSSAENLLDDSIGEGRLDIGCIADAGMFTLNQMAGYYEFSATEKAATIFLFELIARLQASATVPMIDIRAYARWLT
jgi:hypothetical protein